MTAYDFHMDIDGAEIYFGFDGRHLLLFGGSTEITYPKEITMEEVKADIRANYQQWKEEDTLFTYQCYGFYD